MRRLFLGTMGVKSLVQGLNAAATAGFEPRTVWSEVRRRNRLATAPPTWSKKAQRKGQRLFGSEIVDSLAPEIYSPLWTKCFSILFFLFPFFFFFLSHVYLSGKTPFSCLAGATPVPHKDRRASVALICLHCWKEGMYILAKQCVSSERCAMPKACTVCHHGNKVEQTQQLQTKLSLQDVGLVVFLNLARRSLFFVKHDKRTD